MLNVKIKKSVLQNIIKKSLNEREIHNDPSHRLTIGPDTSSLPSMLPLSPSDRMSTQLETERPPVEDPEYIPANSKELGNALQALAEMVPADNVGEAYHAFQKTIEAIELQNVDNIEAQLESMKRKNTRFDALLSEAPRKFLRNAYIDAGKKNTEILKDPKIQAAMAAPTKTRSEKEEQIDAYNDWLKKEREDKDSDIGEWLEKKGSKSLSSEEHAVLINIWAQQMKKDRAMPPSRFFDADEGYTDYESDKPDADSKTKTGSGSSKMSLRQMHQETIESLGLSRDEISTIMDLEAGKSITTEEIETFFDAVSAFANDVKMKKKIKDAIKSGSHKLDGGGGKPEVLAAFIKAFSEDDDDNEALKSPEKDFEWQSQAKPFGYAAASGLRQTFIRDVGAIFSLATLVYTRQVRDDVKPLIRKAFNDALTLEQNQDFLNELFDEEGLEEYKEFLKNPDALKDSKIYRNFAGAITYEVLSQISEFNFKSVLGKSVNGKRMKGPPGRQIAKAFMTEFGNEKNKPLQDFEAEQLESIAVHGTFKDLVAETIEGAGAQGYRGLIAAAAMMAAQDADAKEYGSYNQPAFAMLKKHSAGTKPPEVPVGEYVNDTPAGREFVEKIKASDRKARKFKSTVPESK